MDCVFGAMFFWMSDCNIDCDCSMLSVGGLFIFKFLSANTLCLCIFCFVIGGSAVKSLCQEWLGFCYARSKFDSCGVVRVVSGKALALYSTMYASRPGLT